MGTRRGGLKPFAILLAWFLFSPGFAAETPPRIVSLAPSITEILFALGLGERVVGVTRYCDYPVEAKSLPKIGGYVDPNYEAVVALRPDLVIHLNSHQDAQTAFRKLRIPTLAIPHHGVADTHRAIAWIGAAGGARDRADALLDSLQRRTQAVQQAIADKPRPSVLISIGRDTATEYLAGIHVAGRDGFYAEILALAGGVNAYRAKNIAYPQVTAEGVLRMNPEVIVDLISPVRSKTKTVARIQRQWERLHTLAAVRANRIHIIVGDHALRPGPRYIVFLEELARLLHP